MKTLNFLLIIIFTVTLECVCDTVYLEKEKENIYISPNGKKIGEVKNSAPLEILEETPEWLKINITGWIRKASVNLKEKSVSVLELVSFQKEKVAGNYDLILHQLNRQIKLKMYYRNNGEKTITEWAGLLTVKNVAGRVIFKMNISNRSLNFVPEETQELIMYIAEKQFKNKEVFDYFESTDAKNLKLELTEIAIETKPYEEK